MAGYAYDVFVSHSAADRPWVADWLVPRLEAAGLRVAVDYRDFSPGAPLLDTIKQFVDASRHVIVVVTPAWTADEWRTYEALLTRILDLGVRDRKLIPLLLIPCRPPDCQLPATITDLVRADFTDPARAEPELTRLVAALQRVTPPPTRDAQRQGLTRRDWLRWWLRYHPRGGLSILAVILAGWIALSTLLSLPPFQHGPAWIAEPLAARSGVALYNTGTSLLVGAANTLNGCEHLDKGLWYRPLAGSQWQRSAVGDLLCIEKRQPPALSDVIAFAALPAAPNTVYALTSDTGILVSRDGGATFSAHPVPFPTLDIDNTPSLLAVSQEDLPVLRFAGYRRGLWVLRNDQWSRVDGAGAGGCAGLPDIAVKALLVKGSEILIGTERRGLWLSADGGRTCRRVWDDAGDTTVYKLLDASPGAYERYLALVHIENVEPGTQDTWRLLNLCPRAGSCTPSAWTHEPVPLWQGAGPVDDVMVERTAPGDLRWFLATKWGRVWAGGLDGGIAERLPQLTRCFAVCEMRLAPGPQPGQPYLLAGSLPVGFPSNWIVPGRVYALAEGAWWQRLWP